MLAESPLQLAVFNNHIEVVRTFINGSLKYFFLQIIESLCTSSGESLWGGNQSYRLYEAGPVVRGIKIFPYFSQAKTFRSDRKYENVYKLHLLDAELCTAHYLNAMQCQIRLMTPKLSTRPLHLPECIQLHADEPSWSTERMACSSVRPSPTSSPPFR